MKKTLILLSICLMSLTLFSCKKEIVPDILNGTEWRYDESLGFEDFTYHETISFNTPKVSYNITHTGTPPPLGTYNPIYMNGYYNCTANMGTLELLNILVEDADGNQYFENRTYNFSFEESTLTLHLSAGRDVVFNKIK